MENKKLPPSCETCMHHQYDEDFLAHFCDRMPDEDEMGHNAFRPGARCPFYQFHDEYISVRKQI